MPTGKPVTKRSFGISASMLDGCGEYGSLRVNESKFIAAFLGIGLIATGCVRTVSGTKTAGLAFGQGPD
jgi:hypothetical protein